MPTPAFFFDVTNGRKIMLDLPSGRRTVFYRGVPEQNPIHDERDVLALRRNPDFVEVLAVAKDENTVFYMPIEEAKKLMESRTVTRKAAQQAAETEAATGEPQPVPAAPVSEAPASVKPKVSAKAKK